MDAPDGILRYILLLAVFGFLQRKVNSYDVRCPIRSEWNLTASQKCGNLSDYFCLLDDNVDNYIEFCKRSPNLFRDITWKKGQRCVFRGNLDGDECSSEKYQPFKFRTDGNSDCVYKKSVCQGEGMIIYNNGSTTFDTRCRCDHTQGFAFISKTKQSCFCIPSQEDCSCYMKECGNKFQLSRDYTCTSIYSQDDQSKCLGLKSRQKINGDSEIPDFKPKSKDFHTENDIHLSTMEIKRIAALGVFLLILATVYILNLAWLVTTCYLRLQSSAKRRRIHDVDEVTQTYTFPEAKQLEVHDVDVYTVDEGVKQTHTILEAKQREVHDVDVYTVDEGVKQTHTIIEAKQREVHDVDVYTVNEGVKQTHTIIEGTLLGKVSNVKSHATKSFDEKRKTKKEYDVEEKENICNENIPKETRDAFNKFIAVWHENEKQFAVTEATCEIEERLKKNNCVLVVGHSGNGKSALIRHLALKLSTNEGYEIVPNVLDPLTILLYHDLDRKQVFVIDDFCGKMFIDVAVAEKWSLKIHEILKLVTNNQENAIPTEDQGRIKLLFATHIGVNEDKGFSCIRRLSEYRVSLSAMPLIVNDKIKISKKYFIEKEISEFILEKKNTQSPRDDIFPLLCKLSVGKTQNQINQLFSDPFRVIKDDFLTIKKTNTKQICLVSLCVLLDGLQESTFCSEQLPAHNELVLKHVCKEFDLDLKRPARLKLQAELKSLVQCLGKKYLEKSGDSYHFIHKVIYDIAAVLCGDLVKDSFIKFAPCSFITERCFLLSKNAQKSEHLIYIHEDIEKAYFDRLMTDLKNKITYSTFHNSQLVNEIYRRKFCIYCKQRKPNKLVDILDGLHKPFTTAPKQMSDRSTSISEESYNEYEDYIEFKKPCQFAFHKMKIPLIESAWEGYHEIVNLLIELERDINETDKFGRSALFVACHFGKTDVAKLLLEKKAKHSLCDASNTSPLNAACKRGHLKIVKDLLANGADTSKCDTNSISPLLAASTAGHKAIVETLLGDEHEVHISQCDKDAALFVASLNGKEDVVRFLIKKNANINKCKNQGRSPLMAACCQGHLGVVKILINSKADTDMTDNDNNSALLIASKAGYDEIVEILLKNGADVSTCNWNEKSSLFVASAKGHNKVVRLLIDSKANMTKLDEKKRSPLFIACEKGRQNIVAILLENSDKNVIMIADKQLRSPLYVACGGGFIEIVKMLNSKGAKVNQCDDSKRTPLFVAISHGHTEVVQYLINHEAELNVVDADGHTPIGIACDEGKVEIVKNLVKGGADINKSDFDNKTLLEIAQMKGHGDIETFLKKTMSNQT